MSRSSLSLKTFKTEGYKLIAVYEGKHSLDGRTLSFDVTLTKEGTYPWNASVNFDACEASDLRSVMARLAGWCARAAEVIQRDEAWWTKTHIPLGDEL